MEIVRGGNSPRLDLFSGKCQGGSVVQWEFPGGNCLVGVVLVGVVLVEVVQLGVFGWEISYYRGEH